MATNTTDAVKPGDLPKLTKPQMARLAEVAMSTGDLACLADRHPRTNDALIALNVLERYQWRTMKWVRPTPLGIRILAGFPGDEFDRFRDALAKEPAP